MKTEVRPMLLIKGRVEDRELNVFVQDDWHIRIMDMKEIQEMLLPFNLVINYWPIRANQGRHVGVKVNETIVEN